MDQTDPARDLDPLRSLARSSQLGSVRGYRPGQWAGAAEATVGCPVLRRLATCWAEADQVPV
jgi:hypothetical protein